MKKIYFLVLVLFSQIFLTDSKAQFIKYEDDSGWKMGFNMSGNWQQSDMKAKFGMGFGFTLGSALSQKPGKFFAWDWAYRYQAGWNYGYDTQRDTNFVAGTPFDGNNLNEPLLNNYKNNQGFIHRNYRVNIQEHNLELILTLNRLRERTGIVLYGWGGLGFVGYNVKTNQMNEFAGSIYNYSQLDSGNVDRMDLSLIQDNTYETDALNQGRKWSILPSAGIGLGYQFSPYFTMGWEHKVTFPMNDAIDGKFSDFVNHQGGTKTNDRFHYTGIYFRFHLMRGKGYVNNNNNNNINNYTNTNTNTNTNTTTTVTNTTPVEKPKPIVDFTNPTPSYVTVNNQVYNVMANVYNVDGSSNITFKHNGVESNAFTYSTISKELYSQVILQPGNNIFEIRAVNAEGYDYESRIVVYEIPYVPQAIPPVVTITNPPYSPYNSTSNTFNVTATVLNIDNSSAISYRVNGTLNSNFTYNVSTKGFSSVITLNQGNNTIEIKATNTAGQDVKYATVVYQPVQTQLPPVVTITNPALNPYTVGVNNVTVEVSVLNVASSNDITLKINGAITNAFTYNTSTKQMVIVANLIEGANVFEIKGTNAVGSDTKTTTIIYEKPQTELPPVVTITDPSTNPYTANVNSKVVKATVLNVAASSNITVKLNGNAITNFSFNTTTKVVQFTASNLQIGGNVVDISATNNVGTDAAATTIIYMKTTTNPPPVVTITYPVQDPYNTSSPNVTVAASILNVNAASDVTFKLNGNLNTNFSYDPATDIFTSNVTLLEGNNTIEIKGTNSVGTDSETATLIYTKPCDLPTFSLLQPTSATQTTSVNSQAVLIVANNVTASSQIDFKVNGVTTAFLFDVNTHVISATVNLNEGDNNVTVSAITPCGTVVLPINIKYVRPVQPPVVTITNPATNPYTTTVATHTVYATIQYVNAASNVTFKLNGTPSTAFTFNPSSTQFQANINLVAGANVIEITGTNNDGVDSKTTTIIYQAPNPPCLNPIIALSQPTGNNTVSTIGNVGMSALVQNVAAASDIVFKQNGTTKTITYDASTGLISSSLTLVDGNNNFEIVATNTCGSTTYNFSITYNRPIVPPVVTITNPSQNPFTSSTATTVINATILHVSTVSDVTFTINGIPSTAFTFDANTSQFVSSSVNLNTGNNTFVITGTNNDGTDSESTVVIYNPCNAPVVTVVNPAANTVAQSSPFAYEATVTNVTSSNELTLTQNGNTIPFSFNASNGSVTASVNLGSGNNIMVLTALNACGTDSKSKTIKFTPCLPPDISFTHPVGSNSIESTAPYLVTATITGSSPNPQITFTQNGTVLPHTYSNGNFSANVTLVPGLNNLQIDVTNDCGSNSETRRVTLAECNVPTVDITSPANGSTVTTNSVQVNATVTNVDGQNYIHSAVNNSTTSGTYSAATGIYSFTANLVNGTNVITVNVESDCGTDIATITINADLATNPQVDPMITICHTPPGNPNNKQTLTIPQSAWAAHQAHGDVLGACGTNEVIIDKGNGNGNGNPNVNTDVDANKLKEEQRKKAEEEARKKAEEEAAKKKAEEEAAKKKAEEDARIKAEKDAKDKLQNDAKLKEEAKKKAEEEAAKKKAEEEAKIKAENDAKIKADNDAKLKAETEAKRKAAEEEAKRKAQEDANKNAAEEEAKRKAQEEANRKAAELEAKRKADEEAKRKAQEEANKKAAEDEAKRKAEMQEKIKANQEAKRKAEEEEKKKAEEQKKTEEETKKVEEDKKVEKAKVGIKPR